LTVICMILAACFDMSWAQVKFTVTKGKPTILIKSERSASVLPFDYQLNGADWIQWYCEKKNNKSLELAAGDELYVRGFNDELSIHTSKWYHVNFSVVLLSGSATVSVSGDYMSLLNEGVAMGDNTFRHLFYGCKAINEIHFPYKTLNAGTFTDWVYGVADYGVFWCDDDLSPLTRSTSGIPKNWLINPKQIIIDPITKEDDKACITISAPKYTAPSGYTGQYSKDETVTITLKDRIAEGLDIDDFCINGIQHRDDVTSDYKYSLVLSDPEFNGQNVLKIYLSYRKKGYKITRNDADYKTFENQTLGDNGKYNYTDDHIVFEVGDLPGYTYNGLNIRYEDGGTMRYLSSSQKAWDFKMPSRNLVFEINKTPISYTISGDADLRFDGNYTKTLTVEDNNGIVPFTVAPKTGYVYANKINVTYSSGTSKNVELVCLNREFDIKLRYCNASLKPVYRPIGYSIALTPGDDCFSELANLSAVEGEVRTDHNYGDVINFGLNADRPGYVLNADNPVIASDGVSLSGPNAAGVYSFTMPNKNVTLTANYDAIKYTVTGGEGVSFAGGAKQMTTTVTADDNYGVFSYNVTTPRGYTFTKRVRVEYGAGDYEILEDVTDYKIDIRKYYTNANVIALFTRNTYSIGEATANSTSVKNVTAYNETRTVNYYGDEVEFSVVDKTSDNLDFKALAIRDADGTDIAYTQAGNRYKFAMPDSDVKIYVEYQPIYNISAAGTYKDNLHISKDKATSSDYLVTVSCDKKAGYTLKGLTVKYSSSGTEKYTDIAISDYQTTLDIRKYNSDITITPNYVHDTYSVAVVDAAGKTSVSKTKAYYGDKITVTVQDRKAEGYDLLSVSKDGVAMAAPYEFLMPESDVVIATEWMAHQYSVIYANSYISGPAKATVESPLRYEVTNREASDGMLIKAVKVNGTEIANTGSINMKNYLSDIKLSVEYQKKTYVVSSDNHILVNNKSISKSSKDASVSASYKDAIELSVDNREAEGYRLAAIVCEGAEGSSNLSFSKSGDVYKASLSMPNCNVSLSARYEYVTKSVTYTYKGSGTNPYSYTGKTEVNIDDMIQFGAGSISGKRLSAVSVAGTGIDVDGKTYTVAARGYVLDASVSSINVCLEYADLGKFEVKAADSYVVSGTGTYSENATVNVAFADRTADGYSLSSAEYNGKPLAVSALKASFVMPAENVLVSANYTPILYKVEADPASQIAVTPSVSKASVLDYVEVAIATGSIPAGKKIKEILVTCSGKSDNVTAYLADGKLALDMARYKGDIRIKVTLENIIYSITCDNIAQASKTSAAAGDIITVKCNVPEGYALKAVSANGKAIADGKFAMPAANVDIKATIALITKAVEYKGSFVKTGVVSADINSYIKFTVSNLEAEYKAVKSVTINGEDITSGGYYYSVAAREYVLDASPKIAIAVEYSDIEKEPEPEDPDPEDPGDPEPEDPDYVIISADGYATPVVTSAKAGDEITVAYADRSDEGYVFASASVNGVIINDGKFTMPAQNAILIVRYNPVQYNVAVAEGAAKYLTVSKDKASMNDIVLVKAADRSGEALELSSITINGKAADIFGNQAILMMSDYRCDVLLDVAYKTVEQVVVYTITTDLNTTASVERAVPGTMVKVRVADLSADGYELVGVSCNGKALEVNDYKASFEMPEADVAISATYKIAEYDLEVTGASIDAGGYCAGGKVRIGFSSPTMALEYMVRFGKEAQAAGFGNIDYQTITSHDMQYVEFAVPDGVDYGTFAGYISLKDRFGNTSHDYEFKFAVNLSPDIIRTKLSDMVFVDNSAHEYAGYQWYKNGMPVAGATRQYFIDAPVLDGVYGLELTFQNGDKRKVCDTQFSKQVSKSLSRTVSVYPNPARAYEDVHVSLSGFDADQLTDARMVIYGQSGTVVATISNPETVSTLNLPSGTYSGVLMMGVQKITFKFVVTD